MRRFLILEDSDERFEKFQWLRFHGEIVRAETARSCISFLETNHFYAVFLDHDLGGVCDTASDENSGYAVAKWLREHSANRPAYTIIHSLNTPARKRMLSIIPFAHEIPFAWNEVQLIGKILHLGEE